MLQLPRGHLTPRIYAIQDNFPPGRLPASEEFASTYYDISESDNEDENVKGP